MGWSLEIMRIVVAFCGVLVAFTFFLTRARGESERGMVRPVLTCIHADSCSMSTTATGRDV